MLVEAAAAAVAMVPLECGIRCVGMGICGLMCWEGFGGVVVVVVVVLGSTLQCMT